jgi:hypothetical protein
VDPFLAHFLEARTAHEPGQPPRAHQPRMRNRLGIWHRTGIKVPAQTGPNRGRRILVERSPHGERGVSAGPQRIAYVTECCVEIRGEHQGEA